MTSRHGRPYQPAQTAWTTQEVTVNTGTTKGTGTEAPTLDQSTRHQSWRVVAIVFGITPNVVAAGMGTCSPSCRSPCSMLEWWRRTNRWTGILFALPFILGLTLVAFWGAWADRYRHKLIIARGALVEAAVFGFFALSRNRRELGASLRRVGFQLGNTGVMMASLRTVTPPKRVGLAISLLGTLSAVGLALVPAFGGWLVDGTPLGSCGLFGLDALLSVGTATLIALAARETKPAERPTASVDRVAWRTVRGAVTVPVTQRLFTAFTLFYLGVFVARPYLPLFVGRIHPSSPGLAQAVGLVVGTAALLGAPRRLRGWAERDRLPRVVLIMIEPAHHVDVVGLKREQLGHDLVGNPETLAAVEPHRGAGGCGRDVDAARPNAPRLHQQRVDQRACHAQAPIGPAHEECRQLHHVGSQVAIEHDDPGHALPVEGAPGGPAPSQLVAPLRDHRTPSLP